MSKVSWYSVAPWILSVASIITLFFIGKFLIDNLDWYKDTVFADIGVRGTIEPKYKIYAYHLHLSMVKRSIGLFSGFSVMLLGLAVIFYTLKERSTVEASGGGITGAVTTASPGLIALLVGALLVIGSIQSKDRFPPYNAGDQTENRLDPQKAPTLPQENEGQ